MSFAFAKVNQRKQAKPAKPLLGAPRSAKANIEALHRGGCAVCPLNHAQITTPKMKPTLGSGPIYFLAEAPGEHEDETSHQPLTGPSGSLLRQCIPSGSMDLVSFDNVVNCRPPKNRTPVWNEVECCRPRRIKWIEQVKPRLIVGLGTIALHWALGSSDMAGMRGRLFAIKVGNHSCWFMPTYHPSFILRIAYDKKRPLQSKIGHCFRMDIRKAFETSKGPGGPHVESETEIKSGIQCFDGSGPDDFERLCALLDSARKSKTKSIDVETRGLRPFNNTAAIISVAISFEATTFAFALDHPQSGFHNRGQKRTQLINLLLGLLRDNTTKIAHNAPFEIEWFIWLYHNLVVNHAAWECTQMQAHFLDERRGKQGNREDDQRAPYQSLDFLCKQHFGIRFKSLFKLNKKDMSKSPLNEVLLYNGIDAKYTLRLWERQTKLLKQAGLYDAYLEALPRQPTVALMQSLGVNVDQAEVKRLQKKLEIEITGLEAKINHLPVVQQYKADHKGVFNPASYDDGVSIFKDYLGEAKIMSGKEDYEILDFDVPSSAKKKWLEGNAPTYSVDKRVLEKIDHPLAHLIVDLRNRTKLKSTYVDGLELGKGNVIYPDGKIHCNFNTTFAETGRTSSDAPNMQNFPQRHDAWVRKQVVAPEGHVLVAFDYGQLEACTAAMCSKDKVLVKALWENYDIHQEWAEKTHKKYPAIGKPDRALRSLIKNKLVFPAIFGAQNKSIAGYLNMPEHIIDDLMDEFWGTFTGLRDWQDQLMKHYYEVGWVASPTGRRHHYPLTRNQAINHPVQSLACDIVCSAMNELSIMAVESSKWFLHPRLNIHDDLTFAVPDEDAVIEEAITLISTVMLTPPYKCVNVPLSVEVSIGPAWYGMKEITKIWSHKDV